jgi:hypothetical protein
MLSTKNNNNNSSLTANTITCNTITINNDIINTNLNNSINSISAINSTVNNLTSKINVNSNGVDITTGSFYFNGTKFFSEKAEAITNRVNLSVYIDQF